MLTGDMRRRVLYPFWVEHPLAWEVPGAGIAVLAREGQVGMFNLAWWLMGYSEPPAVRGAYAGNSHITWAICNGSVLVLNGYSLVDYARVLTEVQFNSLVLRLPPAAFRGVAFQAAARAHKILGYEHSMKE